MGLASIYIQELYLKNFRNYSHAHFSFHPGRNWIYGANAQGKTNLLEALYLISTGRSFRTRHLTELIQEGASFFYLEAKVFREEIAQTLKIYFSSQEKRVQIDGHSYHNLHPLLGTLPFVLYLPQDLELIEGPPSVRRRFLNLHLGQSDPLYVYYLTRFWRAMKQRNCLLKLHRLEELDCWEAEMATAAQYLMKSRKHLIQNLQTLLEKQNTLFSEQPEQQEIRFSSSYPQESLSYQKQLRQQRKKEAQWGSTLTGPHRDDASIWIEKKPARLFASEGQKKTAIASLKIAEWKRFHEQTQTPALMGIDDFGMQLDASRQALFKKATDTLGQVFLTLPTPPTEPDLVSKDLFISVVAPQKV